MSKRIVLALGGNALGNNLPEQRIAVRNTSRALADLIIEGHEVVITHGNGPQVGMLFNAMQGYAGSDMKKHVPLSVCVAMSQGYIGYDLQNSLREELLIRGVEKPVTTILTQVVVDKADPAFEKPSKPIGAFLNKEEADALTKIGINVMEDAGRGYRRVVASPEPMDVVELDTISTLVSAGHVVIACGGGGIPVTREGDSLKGAPAVVDKDYASCRLAQMLDADCLIILTAVEKVALNFGQPNEKWLDRITPAEAEAYMSEGHFAPGSMLPKVKAATRFASSGKGRFALITLLEKAKDGIAGKTGTVISED